MISVTLMISSCSKDEETPEPVPTLPTPTPTPVPNKLCSGNGSSIYIPFNTGNAWVFQTTTTDIIQTYEGTETLDTVLYHKIKVVSDWTTYIYYRYNSNGDLYEKKDNFTHIEEMIVPGNPTVGQTWIDPNSNPTYNYSYEVISLNASYTTASCTYTGLLQINELFNGNVSYLRYYKKGLGLVHQEGTGTNNSLKSVTLN